MHRRKQRCIMSKLLMIESTARIRLSVELIHINSEMIGVFILIACLWSKHWWVMWWINSNSLSHFYVNCFEHPSRSWWGQRERRIRSTWTLILVTRFILINLSMIFSSFWVIFIIEALCFSLFRLIRRSHWKEIFPILLWKNV